MLPAVLPGDELIVEKRGIAQLHPGEVVLFTRGGRLCAHRVIAKEGSRLITRGDAMSRPDEPVAECEVLGRVEAINRGTSLVSLTPSVPSWCNRTLSAVLRHSEASTKALLWMLARRRFFSGDQYA